MILVDTSAWIDFLSGRDTAWTQALKRAMRSDEVVVGDLVLMEVLQGIRDDRQFAQVRRTLQIFPIRALCDARVADAAALNYRALRRRGITVRGTVDVLIATWCLTNEAEIIHNDRDLGIMETVLGLRSYS